MGDEELRDLLIRLDERTTHIQKQLNSLLEHADNGGWKRCVRNDGRIQALEDKGKVERWWKRTGLSAILVLAVERIWNYVF